MKRYIKYCSVLCAMLFASCMNMVEGLDEADALIVSANKVEMQSDGGESTITVDAFCSWKVSSSEDWSWITVSSKSGNKGNGSFKLILSENTSVDDRTAIITVENRTYDLSHEIVVLQKAGAPFVRFSKDRMEVTEAGINDDIVVTSNIDYVVSSSAEWCQISSVSGTKGKKNLTVDVLPSPATTERTAVITFSNAEYKYSSEVEVVQSAFTPILDVNYTELQISDLGQEKTLSVVSNIPWSVSCDVDWVELSKYDGNGDATITANIVKNNSTEEREAKIVITNSEYEVVKEIVVRQLPIVPNLKVSGSNYSVSNLGDTKTVTISSNISWVATCEAEWVTVTPVNGSAGENNINIKVARNASTNVRKAKVIVANAEYGLSKEISISQDSFAPSLEVSDANITALVDGYTKDITITSNVNWSAVCEAEWISLSEVNGAAGNETVSVTVSANTTTSARESTILIKNTEYDITKEITVSQPAFVPSLEVSQTSYNAALTQNSKSITVTSNIEWTASCSASWISLSKSSGGSGTSTITINVDANDTVSSRTASIQIKNTKYNQTKTITVSQEAFTPSLAVSTSSVSASGSGESKSITVTSNMDWTASCPANWISLSKSSGTSGTSTITINIDANATVSSRTASIQIKNTKYNQTKTITVSQEAFVPSLTVSNSSVSVSGSGESKSITVTSNIVWEATSASDWISLAPVNGQKGMSTLVITAARNGLSPRSATVTIRNREYDLTQDVTVSQSEFVPELTCVSGSSLTLNHASGTKFIQVDANIPYTVSSNAAWLTVEKVTDGINLTYTSNQSSTTARTATVLFESSEYPGFDVELSVTQSGLSLSNIVQVVSSSGLVVPTIKTGWGANIVSVASDNGTCEIGFDGPVTAIPSNAFNGMTNITSVILPTTVESIGESAFYGCTNLESITLPSTVTSIGESAFRGCTALESISLPSGLNAISSYAFYGCTSLASATLPSGLTSIGSYAFYNCSALDNLDIPQGVTSIGTYAFYECSKIDELKLSGSSISIGSYAFNSCTDLTEVEIEGSLSSLGSYAFQSCSKLQDVRLAEGITSIGERTFYNCSALRNVNIPTTVTSIGSYAFYSCSELSEIMIPGQVKTISTYAFAYCSSLEFITIPNSVTSIGSYAFANCSSLENVLVMRNTPPTGANNMFRSNASGRRIYVPVGTASTYRNASYWNSYSSYIYEVSYTPTECTSLSITAEDVSADATTTLITYSAITNGSTQFGTITNVEVTGQVQSDSFEENTSNSAIQRTISFTYLGVTATTTITQRAASYYTVSLNNQWRKSSSVSNPDSSTYDGVYESYSNYHVDNSGAVMYVDIEGYDTFTLYIRSYAESTYDYVMVSKPNQSISYNTSYSSSSVQAHTRGNQNSSTSISAYTPVTYTGLNGGEYRITIVYRKDSSQDSGSDRGYLLIPKN